MNKKRTKIVATISDKNCEPEFIGKLYDAGMNVVRINSAHVTTDAAIKMINNVRKVSDKIAILLDTKGPEIRTTACDNPVVLKKGETIQIIGNPNEKTSEEAIYVSYPMFSRDVPMGSGILIDDGEIELKAIKTTGAAVECRIENDGILGSRKSVNVPGSRINLPSVTERDRVFLKMAVENGVDFIAHSFVRSKQDVLDVKAEMSKHNGNIKIIAKIENQEGVDNLDDILENVYGVMVARGDLAIEVPYETIPVIQKMIINKCIISRKPVIVATQMLHSMITNPRPTRAEISDIANAIYSQTDAIMLSGETANGKYPVEAVLTMSKVAMEVEKNKEEFVDIPYVVDTAGNISGYLSKVAVKTALRLNTKGIIADTEFGRTIRDMAAYRGFHLILARCYSLKTMRELALSYGVYAGFQESSKSVNHFVQTALKQLLKEDDINGDDIFVLLSGNFHEGQGFSAIVVGSVNYLKNRAGKKEESGLT
jgi:pyruvate kinase